MYSPNQLVSACLFDLDHWIPYFSPGNREVSRDDVPMILHACEMALQAAGAEELQCIANARRDFG